MLLKRYTPLVLALVLISFIASGIGATTSGNLWSYLFGSLKAEQIEILLSIRFPRIATALLAGFLIGIAGAIMQRTFANQLAEPTLLGTTAAAALGTVLAIVLGVSSTNTFITLPIAFSVALLVSMLTINLGGKSKLKGSNLIIVGIAIAALLNALIATVAAISGNQEIRAISFWSSGTLSFARGETVLVLGIVAALVTLTIPYLARHLDLFVFNPVQLKLLGYSIRRLQLISLAITSLAVAATVVSIGAVAFLGLAAPFVARFIFGESMKYSLLGAGLFGSFILLVSDTLARIIAAPNELPISVVTSLIGAPFLLLLVVRKRGAQNA